MKLRLCVDNAPSVFCEDLMFTPEENRKRKQYHKQVFRENVNILILKGLSVNREYCA